MAASRFATITTRVSCADLAARSSRALAYCALSAAPAAAARAVTSRARRSYAPRHALAPEAAPAGTAGSRYP